MISTGPPAATELAKDTPAAEPTASRVQLVQYQQPFGAPQSRPLPTVAGQNLGRRQLLNNTATLNADDEDDPAPPPPSGVGLAPREPNGLQPLRPLRAPRRIPVDAGRRQAVNAAPNSTPSANAGFSRTVNRPTENTTATAPSNIVRRLPESQEIQLDPSTRHRLETPGAIGRIEIADRTVCEAVSNGGREATLIAKGQGTTTMLIWCGTQSSPMSYRVKVGRSASVSRPTNDAQLQTWLAERFANNNIQLVSHNETLIVSGVARSENEALNILSAVRDLRLIPVVDQIKVRR